MPEKVLNLPLSGLEVRNAILDKLAQKLQKDCYLSENAAYDYFSANIDIHLLLHDVGRDVTIQSEVGLQGGDLNDGVELTSVNDSMEIAVAPPNEVRVETGQEVPVLTTKDGKPEVKGVRYARTRVQKK